MQQATLCAGLALLSAAALAQTPADKPAFEVASVKTAAPPTPGRFMTGMRGGPGTSDPGQATFSNVNQRFLLSTAYDVQDYQISGPSFLDTERYDIVAKVPRGATKEQFRLMLQDLLAERFHLTLHRETKQLPLYALVVAKSGPKMKQAAPPAASDDSDASNGFAGGPPPGPPPGMGGGPGGGGPPPGGGGMQGPPMGKDGFPRLPPGMARAGVFMMMMRGRARLIGNGQPMSKLADALQRELGHPVADKTGLTGVYDFTLEFDPASVSGMRGMMPPPPPGGGGGPGGPGGGLGGGAGSGSASGGGGQGPGASQPDSDAPGLFDALQRQLGLKLEQKKGPLDLLIIDHSEKNPDAN